MVFTRSSRCETRSSAKKKISRDKSPPPKRSVQRPKSSKPAPVSTTDDKKPAPKTTFSVVTRGSKKKQFLESEIEIVKVNIEIPLPETSTVEDNKLNLDASISQPTTLQQEDFYSTSFYESALSERAQGNPFIKIIAREHDEKSSGNMNTKLGPKEQKGIRSEIVEAFNALAKDNEYFSYLDEDRQFANLSIMPKPLIKTFNEKYDEFRKEALEDAQCRSNRLRPRAEKINYSIMNGAKRRYPFEFRDDLSRSGSNMSNCGSWKGKSKKKGKNSEAKPSFITPKEECSCGKCDDCLREDDAETDGCELSDSGAPLSKKSSQSTLPIERPRRNIPNKLINWKYCYDVQDNAKKGIKRSKIADHNNTETPLKRAKTYPAEKEKPILKLHSGKFSRDSSPAPSFGREPKEKKNKSDGKNNESLKDINDKAKEKALIKKEPTNSHEKVMMKPKLIAKTDHLSEATDSAKVKVEKADESRMSKEADHDKPSKTIDNEAVVKPIKDPKEILRGHFLKVVKDESKIKIYGNPLTAELSEIDNEQFYRLVVVLQGTDFIVKNAAMKNIRGPNETISQLYNCTVCHKDAIEDNSEPKAQGTNLSKPERKEGLKLKSHVDSHKLPEIRPKIAGAMSSSSIKTESHHLADKFQRRNRMKMTPKSQPHIVPRVQPQLAPKPVSKVMPLPQYDAPPPARVPPIIFPSHMKSVVNPESSSNTNPPKETVGQTTGRVVVKATCFQRRPRLEALESGSEDSDNLTLDADLKDRIISDIAQAGKSIPDSRGLREALKRMGRRKTDPDIHPITRRMNKKVVRKMYTGNESIPNILKRTMGAVQVGGGSNGPTSPGRPSQAPVVTSVSVSNSNRPASFKTFNSSPTQKVLLDNRGRYVDPFKPMERFEETPATALTASERLKLAKIDVAKKNNAETTSTSTPTSTPVKGAGGKKDAESGDESDFELAEPSQPVSKPICTTSPQVAITNTPSTSKVSPVHIKILPKPDAAGNTRTATVTGKPVLHDKSGYRKILPRPEPSSAASPQSTPKASGSVPPNVDNNQETTANNQRKSLTDGEESSPSPTKQEREMILLKSILNQKSPTGSSDAIIVKQDKSEAARSTVGNVAVGNLRVPPASSYVSATPVAAQEVKSPNPMRPIMIRMTRVRNQTALTNTIANGVVVENPVKGTEEKKGILHDKPPTE